MLDNYRIVKKYSNDVEEQQPGSLLSVNDSVVTTKGLWKFLQDKDFRLNPNSEYVFKRKLPEKSFIQIKVHKINEKQQIIVFINDITKIKELESISYKVRSMFFSSVTHELRTPLNSIIPLTKLLLNLIKEPRARQYLSIIYNTSLHL